MAENFVSKFDMEVDGGTSTITVKDAGARSLVAQEIVDRSALIKTDGPGNTLITTEEKIVESAHDKETTIIDTNSTRVGGANTVNIGGAHTEVYGSTYGKTVTGKSTVHYNGGSEEIHKLSAKITAPDLTLDIANGITYKKPTEYNDYFKSVVAKDTDGNAYNILVASDSTADLGSAAPYHSFKEFGIDNTGTTDCSDALSSVTDNVALSAGTYLISNNCVVSAQVVCASGVTIKINARVTATFNSFYAPRSNIFTGEGKVVIDNGSWIYPEWFNNNLNRAYDAGRMLSLTLGTYTVDSDLILNKYASVIEGPAIGDISYSDKLCKIETGTHNIVLGDTGKTVVNEFVRDITIRNLCIAGQVSLQQCIGANIENVFSYSTQIANFTFDRCINPHLYNVHAQNNSTISGATCFYIRNNDAHDITNRPVSLYFTDCVSNLTADNNNSYGVRAEAFENGTLSDIYFNHYEHNGGQNGIVFSGAGTVYSFNLHLNGVYFDQVAGSAIAFYNCKKGCVSITDLYAFGNNKTYTPLIYTSDSSLTLLMNNLQIGASNARELLTVANCNLLGENVYVTTSESSNPIVYSGTGKCYIQYLFNNTITTYTNQE